MRIINIVDSAEKINYGIWNTIVESAKALLQKDVPSELWFPATTFESPGITAVPLSSGSLSYLETIVAQRNLDARSDIIITHGSWRFPTRWGSWLKKKGFLWIYVPHGMLEPWAMSQGKLKKSLYFSLFEKRLARNADAIRAVSLPETSNLSDVFTNSRVLFIPNGVQVKRSFVPDIKNEHRKYLFLSRLHHKKNIGSLLKAWIASELNNAPGYELIIAGPDHGELSNILPFINSSSNIKYVGTVYGDEKNNLMNGCSFFALSSFSEGLPTSVLEAMSFGLVPIITEGCNMPEVFTEKLGLKITTESNNISEVLNSTMQWTDQHIQQTGLKCVTFIADHYSIESSIERQLGLISSLRQTDLKKN